MIKQIVVASLFLLTLAGCRDEARQSFLELTGRIFIFNPRVATATYVVTLAVLKPLPAGSQVEAVFDNPAGGEKLKVEHLVRSPMAKIALESPSLLCIKKGKRYYFDVTLKDASGTALQTISSSIESTLDQSILPDLPLVVGPEYQPNPELQGNAAGKLPGGPKHKCPA
jgi:hypothetical protein